MPGGKKQPQTTSWGKVADWYKEMVEDDNSFQTNVILPNLLRLLGDVKNKTILDLGCGNGFFAKEIDQKGGRIVGVDIAAPLIAQAKKLHLKNAQFFVGNAEKLSEHKNSSIDKAICVLALQNIERADLALKEAARVLRPGGEMLVVLNHPAFRIPSASSWQFDKQKNVEYRRVDTYLSESKTKIEMSYSGPKITTLSFHRPLQYYAKIAKNAGLAISNMEEWISHRQPPKGRVFAARDTARKEFPLFLCLVLTKR